ncbi:MAG: Xaa-Pro peptidase family protein [Planctomycetota bacterium]
MTDDRAAQLFAYRDFTADEFRTRRRKLADAVGGKGTALVAGIVALDGSPFPRQNNDFYYLAGLDPSAGYLAVDCERGGEATLYLGPRNPKREDVDGPELSDEDAAFASDVAGVDRVRPISELPGDLAGTSLLHVSRKPAEGFRQHKDSLAARRRSVADDPLMGGFAWPERHLHGMLAAMLPGCTLADLSPALHDLRLTKSEAEVRLLREAGRLTGVAVAEAMRSSRPGVKEHELAAVSDFTFRRGGGFGGAHNPIVASGWANIYAMHYWRLTGKLRAGEPVLMDYAPDYRYYTSDIGRMWSGDGTFADDHRSMYDLCVRYHKILLSEIRPGRTIADVFASARPAFKDVIESWPAPDDDALAAAHKMAQSPRPLSHPVGMAIHDVGDVRIEGRELQVGDVFAVDPELFDHARRRYVRCEDTVVVTDDGCAVLTPCPLEVAEIEEHMASSDGLLQQTNLGLA